MRRVWTFAATAILAVSWPVSAAEPAYNRGCNAAPVALQVLGSGGPIAEGSRAGTSYLLYVDGVPSLLIDSGAGSFLRFGESGAKLITLGAIVLTHFHADHAGDLILILKSGNFEDRIDPLPIFGPASGGRFTGLVQYLRKLLSPEDGAYGYLGGCLDGTEGKPHLVPTEVKTDGGAGALVRRDLPHGVKLTLIPVHHGDVPAFGVMLEAAGKTIIIGGDQSQFSTDFDQRTRGLKPDLFVAHHVIPEGPGQPLGLHRNPASIGELAKGMQARRLVLSHNMRRSLDRLDEGLAAIRRSYNSDIIVADDLECLVP